jgi:predicted nucleic acid-binding protein
VIYLDTSAAVKTLIAEPETELVRALFDSDVELVSSRLMAVELHAVADRRNLRAIDVRAVVDRVALVSLDDDVARLAIDLRSGLRTLDALHLATALLLGDDVTSVLSYDEELISAAERHGLPRFAST